MIAESNIRLIRMRELRKLIGLSHATIYRYIKNGNFPKPIKLSERSVAWRLTDIENWIKEKEELKK